ncbi:MAG: hydrogenase formation protein HypD [Thermodesulfovibrionia bacterium]
MIDAIIKRIESLMPKGRRIKIMNVCGSHEHTIASSGMRSLMPENLELIPGPGCPVCVCPESDIINAIRLSRMDDVILTTYGDMLRVPSSEGSIISNGGNYRMVTSPSEVIRIAKESPDKRVVFFSIGFETTTAPAVAILETGIPDNLFMLTSHRLTPRIMEVLIEDAEIGIDGFIAPGHVSAIVGADAWRVFPERYRIPVVVAGFEPDNLLLGIMELLMLIDTDNPQVGNVYRHVVRAEGNIRAQRLIQKYLRVCDANWRAIGNIPGSGLEIREEYSGIDARKVFGLGEIKESRIPGCICDRVVLGKAYPSECRLFKRTCSPDNPKGPCMVSIEGACNIWFKTC